MRHFKRILIAISPLIIGFAVGALICALLCLCGCRAHKSSAKTESVREEKTAIAAESQTDTSSVREWSLDITSADSVIVEVVADSIATPDGSVIRNARVSVRKYKPSKSTEQTAETEQASSSEFVAVSEDETESSSEEIKEANAGAGIPLAQFAAVAVAAAFVILIVKRRR